MSGPLERQAVTLFHGDACVGPRLVRTDLNRPRRCRNAAGGHGARRCVVQSDARAARIEIDTLHVADRVRLRHSSLVLPLDVAGYEGNQLTLLQVAVLQDDDVRIVVGRQLGEFIGDIARSGSLLRSRILVCFHVGSNIIATFTLKLRLVQPRPDGETIRLTFHRNGDLGMKDIEFDALAEECIEALYSLNQMAQGTQLPVVPREALRGIVERDTLSLLGLG